MCLEVKMTTMFNQFTYYYFFSVLSKYISQPTIGISYSLSNPNASSENP